MVRGVLSLLLLSVCFFSVVLAQDDDDGLCGVNELADYDVNSLKAAGEFSPVVIPIQFHWIRFSGDNDSHPTEARFDKVVEILNYHYVTRFKSGISFRKASTLLVHDETGFIDITLGQQGYAGANVLAGKYNVNYLTTLNIYYAFVIQQNLNGLAKLPYTPWQQNASLTWIFTREADIPFETFQIGVPNPSFDLTKGRQRAATTIAHEVGHWVGLYHTFQGGCDCCGASDKTCLGRPGRPSTCDANPASTECQNYCGDEVSDTAFGQNPQDRSLNISSANYNGCTYDTCTALTGADEAQNIMNYPSISCLYDPTSGDFISQFTTGQIAKMQRAMITFRPSFFGSSASSNDTTCSNLSETACRSTSTCLFKRGSCIFNCKTVTTGESACLAKGCRYNIFKKGCRMPFL